MLSLLQRIFLTQESNQGFLHFRWILYKLKYLGNLNWGSVAEKRIVMRGWSHPRSHLDPQDSCQVQALGFVQERIQEQNNRVKEHFIQEDTHSEDKQWAVSEDKRDTRVWGCHFLWEVGVTQSNEWEEYSRYFGAGVGISRNWATIYSLTFIIMVQVDVSFSLLVCYNDDSRLRLKVQWKSTCLPSWTCLALISLYCVLGLCHSFRDCALPPFCLSRADLHQKIWHQLLMVYENVALHQSTLAIRSKEEVQDWTSATGSKKCRNTLGLGIMR